MRVILYICAFCAVATLRAQEIDAAEYFFETDPGLGNGIALAVGSNTGTAQEEFNIDVSALSKGFHNIYIRTRANGAWGFYKRSAFYVATVNTAVPVTAAEYFFDVDPGVGMGTALALNANTGTVKQEFLISVEGLANGFHNLYMRTQDENGGWGTYKRQGFYIGDFNSGADIQAAEYFVDSDPGIGNGTALDFGNANSNQSFNATVSNTLADGEHIFYIRVKNSEGTWSIYDAMVFNVNGTLGIEDSLFKSTKIYPSPFVNNISIKLPQHVEILKTTIYNTIGQTIYTDKPNKTTLQLSHLESGMYILNLETNMGKASFRIIKK